MFQNYYKALFIISISQNCGTVLVHADDKDSEENSRVLYSVDDHNFVVNERGEISAKNRLDADQKRERFYFYRFNVTAKDNGNPPSKSKAMVISSLSVLPICCLIT